METILQTLPRQIEQTSQFAHIFSLGIAGSSEKSKLLAVLEAWTSVRLVKIVQSGGIWWALRSLGAPNRTVIDGHKGRFRDLREVRR